MLVATLHTLFTDYMDPTNPCMHAYLYTMSVPYSIFRFVVPLRMPVPDAPKNSTRWILYFLKAPAPGLALLEQFDRLLFSGTWIGVFSYSIARLLHFAH